MAMVSRNFWFHGLIWYRELYWFRGLFFSRTMLVSESFGCVDFVSIANFVLSRTISIWPFWFREVSFTSFLLSRTLWFRNPFCYTSSCLQIDSNCFSRVSWYRYSMDFPMSHTAHDYPCLQILSLFLFRQQGWRYYTERDCSPSSHAILHVP